MACALSSGGAEAKYRKRRRFDLDATMKGLKQLWVDTTEDVDPANPGYNCDEAIDALILQLPNMGSVLYVLFNGWYLGQWADYSSCLRDATNSQYVLADIQGTYNGDVEFTRGGMGKFSPNLSTRMGLCFPKQCKKAEIDTYTRDWISNYATGAGFEDISISYTMSTEENEQILQDSMNGLYLVGGLLLVLLGFVGFSTAVELCGYGDKEKYKEEPMPRMLNEAAKFRRVTQYDSVLLQRKEPWAQNAVCFSISRSMVGLNM